MILTEAVTFSISSSLQHDNMMTMRMATSMKMDNHDGDSHRCSDILHLLLSDHSVSIQVVKIESPPVSSRNNDDNVIMLVATILCRVHWHQSKIRNLLSRWGCWVSSGISWDLSFWSREPFRRTERPSAKSWHSTMKNLYKTKYRAWKQGVFL